MSKQVTVRHGRITVAVPEGWEDDTTVSLLGPLKQHAGSAAVPTIESSRSTLVVSIERLPPGIAGAQQFLQRLGDGLKAAGTRLREHGLEQFEMSGKPGFIADREVELPDGKIRQLSAAVVLGGDVVLATAAADSAVFERERRGLVELLAAVRVE
jgi:hypothetical protein